MSDHRVLIIGGGGVARHHVAGFRRVGARIAGLADTSESRAKAFMAANNLDGEAAFWPDYRDALARGNCDIVSICTPPYLHCAQTIDCLNAGAHVLLEKPMALSLAECDAMIAAAEHAGRLLSVVAQNRYKTETVRVRELIASGKCGRVLFAQALSAWWRGDEYYSASWHGKRETEGGGCTLNLAVHQIDLLLWMAGKPGEITAFMSNVNHRQAEVEDLSLAVLRFADGPAAGGLGHILASTIHHGEGQQLLFQTEQAGFSLPASGTAPGLAPLGVCRTRAKPGGGPQDDPAAAAEIISLLDAIPPLEAETFDGQIADFVRCVEAHSAAAAPLLPDGGSGRAAIEVVTGIYKSAAARAPVTLPIAADDPWYAGGGRTAD